MPFRTPHSEFRIRAAHTLVELVVAATAGSVLLAALASTMYIARQVAYSPVHAQRVLDGTNLAFDLVDELQHAIYVVDHGPRHIEFVTEDRNGDDVEDTFRYAWSGTAGDPLTKAINRGSPVNVIDSVSSFDLQYAVQQHEERLETAAAGTALQIESSSNGRTGYVELKRDSGTGVVQHFAQRINLSSLPVGTKTWSLSRVSYYAREESSGSAGRFAVQLRRAASDGLPTSEVVAEWIVLEDDLSDWSWHSVAPTPPIAGLSPHADYCVVLKWLDGEVAAQIGIRNDPHDLIETVDGGATWQAPGNRGSLMVRVYAIPHAADQPLSFSRDRLHLVHLSLQCSDSGFSRIDTAVTLKNAPALVEKGWRTDFSGDPTTQDRNGDDDADFQWSGGSTFDTSTIREGVWQVSGYLWAEHPDEITSPLVIDLRGESIGTGGHGLAARAVVRLGGSDHVDVTAALALQADGTQTARLLAHDGTATQTLTTVPRLPAGPLDLRLVLDPLRRLAALQVKGVDYPVVSVPIVSSAVATNSFYIAEDSSHAEYDYASFQVVKP